MVAPDTAPYLLARRLAGRRATIVGGGAVAARRIPALLDSGADVVVVSPELSPPVAELAAGRQIRWIRRGYAHGDCAGSWLVSACTSDPDVNSAVAQEADVAGVWCVRADDTAASLAWTPASGTAGDVRVAVLSGDPRRSAGISEAIVGALASGAIAAPRGREPRGGELGGWVALVGGGPGDPGLITVRGRQLLAEAGVVGADRLAPRFPLARVGSGVEGVGRARVSRWPAP